MKQYANKKNLVAAIRKLEESEPKAPTKGPGNERVATRDGDMLAALIGKSIDDCRHVQRIYARRSKTAKHNKMQFGDDVDYVSPEMDKILADNSHHAASLRDNYCGYKEWINATA